MSLPEQIVNLLEESESLKMLGVNDQALTRLDALHLLKLLEEHNISVFGGDVYVRNQNQINPTYDSWFCERTDNETQEAYVKRSLLYSKDYIKNYKTTLNGEKLFTIIFDRH